MELRKQVFGPRQGYCWFAYSTNAGGGRRFTLGM